MDCSPPGSSAHGILQARILEGDAMPSSRGVFLEIQETSLHLQSLLHWRAGSLPLVLLGSHVCVSMCMCVCIYMCTIYVCVYVHIIYSP